MPLSGTVGTASLILASQWNNLEADFAAHQHTGGTGEGGTTLMSLSLTADTLLRLGTPHFTTTMRSILITPLARDGDPPEAPMFVRAIGTADPSVGIPACRARYNYLHRVVGFTTLPADCYGGGTVTCLGVLAGAFSSKMFDAKVAVTVAGPTRDTRFFYGTTQTVNISTGSIGSVVEFGNVAVSTLVPNGVITTMWERRSPGTNDNLTQDVYLVGWRLRYTAV